MLPAVNKGNPRAGKAKDITKDIVWASVHKMAQLIFKCSIKEAKDYVEKHGEELSKAELTLFNNADDPRVIWLFIERIIGKYDFETENRGNIITHDDILKRIQEARNAKQIGTVIVGQVVEDAESLQDS